MKKFFSKLVCVITAVALALSMSSCDKFFNDLEKLAEELAKKINATVKGISYIMDHFDDFTNPLLGNGQITDEWVNGNLDDAFVRPDYLVNFAKGYYEENGEKKSYSNLGTLSSMADMDRYVQSLKEAGFDAYHEAFSWDFYDIMVRANSGKLCMALKKGDVYVQLAYFKTATKTDGGETSGTDGSDTSLPEDKGDVEAANVVLDEQEQSQESASESSSGDSSETGEVIDKTVNAVFTIANYDLLSNSDGETSCETSGETTGEISGETSESGSETSEETSEGTSEETSSETSSELGKGTSEETSEGSTGTGTEE